MPYEHYEDETIARLSYVDRHVYEDIKAILTQYELIEHCDAICSILKDGYTNKILAEINNVTLKEFNKELLNMFFLLKVLKSIQSLSKQIKKTKP